MNDVAKKKSTIETETKTKEIEKYIIKNNIISFNLG
jgi:hypothetical protein